MLYVMKTGLRRAEINAVLCQQNPAAIGLYVNYNHSKLFNPPSDARQSGRDDAGAGRGRP